MWCVFFVIGTGRLLNAFVFQDMVAHVTRARVGPGLGSRFSGYVAAFSMLWCATTYNHFQSWYVHNLQISIPVTVVVGVIVILLLWALTRCA